MGVGWSTSRFRWIFNVLEVIDYEEIGLAEISDHMPVCQQV
jgi:hypothetical protein